MENRQNTTQIVASQINSIKNGQNIVPNDISEGKQLELYDMMYTVAINGLKSEYKDIFYKNDNIKYIITSLWDGTIESAPFVSVSIYNNTDIPVRYLFSLEKWWPKYVTDVVNINNKKTGKIGYPADWTNCECTYINYVKNKAEIKNKIYGWKRTIDLNVLYSINKKETLIPMSNIMSKVSSTDMFTYQYKNNIRI